MIREALHAAYRLFSVPENPPVPEEHFWSRLNFLLQNPEQVLAVSPEGVPTLDAFGLDLHFSDYGYGSAEAKYVLDNVVVVDDRPYISNPYLHVAIDDRAVHRLTRRFHLPSPEIALDLSVTYFPEHSTPRPI